MSAALDATVKAMREEIVSQFQERGGGYFIGKSGLDWIDGEVDLEKAARAGLAALRTPTAEVAEAVRFTALNECDISEDIELVNHVTSGFTIIRAMIDKILEEPK